jgi:alginate O-acetyltransferase complex protein AlgI
MAIGLAMMMGFRFPENFAQPYRSISVTEFWRRWHMTLSRWFRDYVYIPMGGSRHGRGRAAFALLTVFFLTALWHGAAWTFLIWGALHSAMLIIERATGLRSTRRFAVLRRLGMLVFIVLSWVPFRSTSVDGMLNHWSAMFTGSPAGLSPLMITNLTPSVLLAVAIAIVSLIGPADATGFGTLFGGRSAQDLPRIRMRVMVPAACVLLVVGIGTALWSDFSPFLYFQF